MKSPKKAAARAPVWIRFMAPVNQTTAGALIQCIDHVVHGGCDHIHLMISSPGGSVFHGLSLHNYLRGLHFPVTTYNFGSVDSIGVVIFCAGAQRVCVPHARFLIHGVSLNVNGSITLDAKGIEEYLKSVHIDAENIARVIADTCGKSQREVEGHMIERTTLTPQQARDYGLVTNVEKSLYQGGMLYAVYENGQVFQSSQGMEMLNHVTSSPMNTTGPAELNPAR